MYVMITMFRIAMAIIVAIAVAGFVVQCLQPVLVVLP